MYAVSEWEKRGLRVEELAVRKFGGVGSLDAIAPPLTLADFLDCRRPYVPVLCADEVVPPVFRCVSWVCTSLCSVAFRG